MANRNFNRLQALDKEMKHLHLVYSVGAVGAPTAVKKLGVTSVARVSAGLYRITLDDTYNYLMHLGACVQLAAGAPAALGGHVIRAESVGTTKLIDLEFVDGAGAAVELDSGSVVRVVMMLKNSSL